MKILKFLPLLFTFFILLNSLGSQGQHLTQTPQECFAQITRSHPSLLKGSSKLHFTAKKQAKPFQSLFVKSLSVLLPKALSLDVLRLNHIQQFVHHQIDLHALDPPHA